MNIDLGKLICSIRTYKSEIEWDEIEKAHVSMNTVSVALNFIGEALDYALRQQGLEYKDGAIKSIERKPKFNAGDWVVYTGHLLKDSGMESYVMQVKSIEDGRYNFTDTSILCFDSEKYMRLWTIQDAKPGDVLCTYEGVKPKIVFILKGTPKKNYALSYYCFYNIMYSSIMSSPFETDEKEGCLGPRDEDVKPATKEQRDLLFQKIKEAGYEWDADTLTLKKIEKQSTIRFSQLADNEAIRLKPIDFDNIDVDAMVERYKGRIGYNSLIHAAPFLESTLDSEVKAYKKGLEDMFNVIKGKEK